MNYYFSIHPYVTYYSYYRCCHVLKTNLEKDEACSGRCWRNKVTGEWKLIKSHTCIQDPAISSEYKFRDKLRVNQNRFGKT